jgi:hypothetical protein
MSTVGPDREQPFSGLEDPSVDATVLRMLLGTQLRRLREAAGITPEQAGFEIRGSRSKHRVGLRLTRQSLLTRPEPPRIWSVMDEAVLRRPVGGPAVMHARLKHLLEVADLSHVTLQVVPFEQGGHAGAGGSFAVLRFEERDLPDVVYIEQLTGAVYLNQRPDDERYLAVVDQLSGEALTPAATRGFINQVAQQT